VIKWIMGIVGSLLTTALLVAGSQNAWKHDIDRVDGEITSVGIKLSDSRIDDLEKEIYLLEGIKSSGGPWTDRDEQRLRSLRRKLLKEERWNDAEVQMTHER